MEDLYISTGNYVQNAQGQIVQFVYGNDCMDGCQLEKQSTKLGTCSQEEFQRDYVLSIEDLQQNVIKRFVPTSEDFQEKELAILSKLHGEIMGEYYYVPFNIERIIASVKHEHPLNTNKKTQMSSKWIVEQLEEFFATVRINKILGMLRDHLLTYSRFIIWSKLNSKQVITKHKLNKKCFKLVLEQIREKIESGFVQAGEMVGPIAAQSIGEKLTQCVLDSFHSSGIAAKTQMSGGVQRFQEIIHVSKKPNNPALYIALKDEYKEKHKIKKIQEQIQYSNLEYFLTSFCIYYDSSFTATGDSELINHHRKWFPEDLGKSPWVIVLEIDPAKLFQKKLEMEELVANLDAIADDKKLSIIASDHNASSLKIHLRPLEHGAEDYQNLMMLQSTLLETTICGVQGILETEIIQDKQAIGAISQGSQLRDILSMPWTDTYNTTSTNIHEILEIFGIEATRQLIIQEVYKFLEQNGVYVNERHIDLLADFITNQGILIALDRHGIAKSHHSVLTAGSFETVVPFLSKAGVFQDRDNLDGVSPNIILGQIGKFGTGLSSIMME